MKKIKLIYRLTRDWFKGLLATKNEWCYKNLKFDFENPLSTPRMRNKACVCRKGMNHNLMVKDCCGKLKEICVTLECFDAMTAYAQPKRRIRKKRRK